MSKICGIYKILNIINNHCYIGSSNYIHKRWVRHKLDLKYNKHHSIYLQRAWNKYGEKSFEFSILEECLEENLITLEQKYIDLIRPEYNISIIAGRTVHTEEMKRNASIRMSGDKHPFYGKKRPEHSLFMIEHPSFKDKKHSPESIKKQSLIKCKLSKEQILKVIDLIKKETPCSNIAKIFNCSTSTIYRITHNKIKVYNNINTGNMDFKKNRGSIGENNPSSKLNESLVRTIRDLRNNQKLSLQELSDKFNISVPVISTLSNFKTWKHVI